MADWKYLSMIASAIGLFFSRMSSEVKTVFFLGRADNLLDKLSWFAPEFCRWIYEDICVYTDLLFTCYVALIWVLWIDPRKPKQKCCLFFPAVYIYPQQKGTSFSFTFWSCSPAFILEWPCIFKCCGHFKRTLSCACSWPLTVNTAFEVLWWFDWVLSFLQ